MQNFLKDHFASLLTISIAIIYATGFFFWNLYLSSFGFFEYNVVEVRYLSTGLLFWIPLIFIFLMIWAIFMVLEWPIVRKGVLTAFYVLFLIGWLLHFKDVFSWIPQYAGGSEPIPTTVIGTPSQIEFLENFAITAAPNSKGKPSVQTYPVCLIYQNDQYALLFFAGSIATTSGNGLGFVPRVFSIPRSAFMGFHENIDASSQIQCGLSGALYNGIIRVPVLKN